MGRMFEEALLMWATVWYVTPSEPGAESRLLELTARLTSSDVTVLDMLLRSMVGGGSHPEQIRWGVTRLAGKKVLHRILHFL